MMRKMMCRGLAFVTALVMAVGLMSVWVEPVEVRAEGRVGSMHPISSAVQEFFDGAQDRTRAFLVDLDGRGTRGCWQ